MKDETLLKISVIASIGGLILLFYVSQFVSSDSYVISDMNPELVGKTVKITGNISSIYVSQKGHGFLKIKDNSGEITGVLFKNSFDKIKDGIKIGNIVEISGKLDEYEGELEILIKDISVLA